MMKRLLSILLLVTMLFTMLPAETMAAMVDNAGQANGTTADGTTRTTGTTAPGNPFRDILSGSWYEDAVQYARVNGIFSGTSATTFDPDGPMTRAMFVTVLGRMAGVDPADYTGNSAFRDVKERAYYAPYVAWASNFGITSGVGYERFDPDDLITREQMAVFFVRYFEAFNVAYDTGANITIEPADLASVSPWAREMVLKLWKTGLLAGDGGNFNPTGKASRAEAATLAMRTDKAVETWYSEPGVPSGRVRVDPQADRETKTPNPNAEDDSDSGSYTSYYKVNFVTGAATAEKVYPRGTLLSTLPVPAQPNGQVFLGWYFDAEMGKPVTGEDRLTANTTLYASFADAVGLEEGGNPNFVSELDQAPGFSLRVKAASQPVPGTDFFFRNITAPEKTPEISGSTEDSLNLETVRVAGGDGGIWTISSSSSGGFTPGHTYQIELVNDAVIYDDSAAVFGDMKQANARYDIAAVRFYNFSIVQDGTLNLKLDGSIKYLSVASLNEADGTLLLDYAGLYRATTDGEGNTTYTANNGSGSFTYGGTDIQAGDTVAVYSGTNPTERAPEKGTDNGTDNGEVAYVRITAINGSTYSYVAAEAEEVLFTPDVLPIDVDAGDGTTGWTADGTSVVITTSEGNNKLDFSTGYENMGLGADTTVDAGDFLAFYTGTFGSTDAQDQAYGEILTLTVNSDGTTNITYDAATEADVMSAMALYDETQLTEAELQDVIDESGPEIQSIIEARLMESTFFDEAGEYLAELALQTDEVQEVFGEGLTLSEVSLNYADGTPLGTGELALMGNIVDKDAAGKKPKVSVSLTPRLSHFTQSSHGLRAEVAVSYTFEIQKSGNRNKMAVELTAFFEQEVTLGFSVSGGAVWKKKWIFPYIADYRMNGNLDLGTYTGIGITATAKLTQDKEPWGMPWPTSAKEAAATKKIFSLSESIKKKMKEVESVLPEAETTASGGLAEKYAAFMEDANKDWVDLVKVNLLNLRGAVDPFHILAYGLQVDFVVSANLNVAIGMTFQYENFKRHSFTLTVKGKKADSKSVDLSTNGYQFDFYVMGTIGVRAGIRAKATVGLFSTKLAGIGLQIEAGAYARLWGYFYYHLENWKIAGKWQKQSSYSGAVLIEIGAYLEVKFIAEALNGKYSYAPTLYAQEWPLWSAGQRENVYAFALEDDPTYAILNVNTYTLPSAVFDMRWMDLKSGALEAGGKINTKNYDSNTASNGDDEARFAVSLSNPNFTYNPVNNRITVNTASGLLAQSSDMTLTWKGAPLSGSSETLRLRIRLNWSNEANAGTLAFESNGGSAVQMLRLLAGTALAGRMPVAPTRVGHTFAGWYRDASLNTAFTGTTMPAGNTTLYAKWTPNTVGYAVEHYQKALDGQYVLTDTDTTLTGLVGAQTAAVAKTDVTYTGFTAQAFSQQPIAADGSTRVAIYYDRNTYHLTFMYGNGSNDITVRAPYGSRIVIPANPTKPGYTFSGWNAAIPATMPASALTFTAQWTTQADISYTVRHVRQALDGTYPTNGDLVTTETLTGSAGQDTAATAGTYTGFTAQTVEQESIAADGSTVVEIRYTRNSHLLTWHVNEGNALTDDAETYTNGTTKYGTIIVKPADPTFAGHSFGGWFTDDDLTIPLEAGATMPDIDLTLYARWVIEEPTTADYTVKHIRQDLNGIYPETGVLVETEALAGTIGQVAAAEAKSYTGFTAQAVAQQTIAADGTTVVVIQYARNNYTVTYNGNGSSGGSMTSQTFLYGETKNLSSCGFYRVGFTFTGWITAADGNGTGYSDAVSVTNLTSDADGTVTLYAQWAVDANAEYGIWVNGISVTSGNAINVFDDGKVSYDVTTRTLTLNGATLDTAHNAGNTAVIYANGTLIVELTDGTINTLTNSLSGTSWNCGIYVSGGNLTIRGAGSLNVTGGTGYTSHGISVQGGTLTMENGVVQVIGQSAQGVSAIYASAGINISGGEVTVDARVATGGLSRGLESTVISITGGTVTASGENHAITGNLTTERAITASTNKDGSSPVETYIPGNIATYKYIRVSAPSK